MINNTLDFYNNNSKTYIEKTLSGDTTNLYNKFLKYVPQYGAILDLGCGSGRDTKYFIDNGYEVDAMDGSKELCKAATKYTGIQVQYMLFENFNDSNIYDGIWACASILHLKKCELSDMIKRLYKALKEDGVIYMSFKYGDFEGVRNGRYFTYLTEESFDMLMEPINGFKKEKIWATGDVREDRGTEQWLNIILRKVTTI